MRILICLAVGLIACNQPSPTTLSYSKADTATSVHKDSLVSVDTPQETNLNSFNYDITIYDLYISEKPKLILAKELPGWHLLNPDNWDVLTFQQYKSEKGLVNYITADFNCDKVEDYVLLLADTTNKVAVWIILSNNETYSIIKLHDLGQLESPMLTGIEVVPKGPLDYIDLDKEEFKTIQIDCPGIQVMRFESAAVTYYWDKNKFDAVQTAD